jgi:hypothetical protein
MTMNLFSFCPDCEVLQPADGSKRFGDFDRCPKCHDTMELWTEAGVRNENARRFYSGRAALSRS